jgi:hypothetical protein
MKNTDRPYMSVPKLPLLVDLQQKLDEFVLSIIACPTVIIIGNALKKCVEKCCYCNFDHRYNVSCGHFPEVLGVGNFTKVLRVCADRLRSGPDYPSLRNTAVKYLCFE